MMNKFGVNGGAQSLEKETEDQFTTIDEPLIQKTSHNIQDIGETIISNEKWILYLKKQNYMQAEVQFLKNFCSAFNIELTIKYVGCDSFSNISVPCIKIRSYLIEKKDFSDLIYQGFCQKKNIQDINTKKYYEYLIGLMDKIQMALEYEMWYDEQCSYSYRNKLLQLTQPLETLQNLYNYKLEKSLYIQLGINNQADVKEIDQLPKLTRFYEIFTDIKQNFPVETLIQQKQADGNGSIAEQKENNNIVEEQCLGGINPQTKKQKIISYCVVGIFTSLYLLGKQ